MKKLEYAVQLVESNDKYDGNICGNYTDNEYWSENIEDVVSYMKELSARTGSTYTIIHREKKEQEFPETSLTDEQLWDIWYNELSNSSTVALRVLANEAIKRYIEDLEKQ